MKKSIIVIILMSCILNATSVQECRSWYNSYVDKYNLVINNSEDLKKYPLLILKSYQDDIISKCKGKLPKSIYKDVIETKPTVKKMWYKYIPKQFRDLPQNKWIN